MSHRGTVGGRGGGKSAAASGAYQDGREYYSERDDRTWDYTRGAGRVVMTDILAPADTPAEMVASGERLWNHIEAAEDRYCDHRYRKRPELAAEHKANAQIFVSGHFTLANELSHAEAEAVVRRLLTERFVNRGMIVSFAIHGDLGNLHFHYQAPLRRFIDGEPAARHFRKPEELRAWDQETRRRCAAIQNEVLIERGSEVRVEARSFAERGIELEPGVHIGPAGRAIADRGERSVRVVANDEVMARNAERVSRNPELILRLLFADPGDRDTSMTESGGSASAEVQSLTANQATLTERDIARRVHRLTLGDEVLYTEVLARVMADPRLQRLGTDADGRTRFTTTDYLEAETKLFQQAEVLRNRKTFGLSNASNPVPSTTSGRKLSEEQTAAVRWMTGNESLACVQGFAGTGKTTIMKAARELWQGSGYRVRGATLAWKAAKLLESESGISSQSLASLVSAIDRLHRLEGKLARGEREGSSPWVQAEFAELRERSLKRGDVLVVDESSMVDVRTASILAAEATRVGAKLVMIGDVAQFQAIGAGRAFGGLVERCGAAELKTIIRQKADAEDVLRHVAGLTREEARNRAALLSDETRRSLLERHGAAVEREGSVWRREAAQLFAAGETRAALEMYHQRGALVFHDNTEQARAALVQDYTGNGSGRANQAIYAYTNAEVDDLNLRIRAELQHSGELGADLIRIGGAGYAIGDRILFTANDHQNEMVTGVGARDGGAVYNNSEGTVTAIEAGRVTVKLDEGRTVAFNARQWQHIRHGYAMSQYKGQGQTIGDARDGRVHLMASRHMTADAAYVAFTRSRHETVLHIDRSQFADLKTLADSMSRVAVKDLASDYLRGDQQRQAVVRDLKDRTRRYAEIMAVITRKTEGDRRFSDHPRWAEAQSLMAERTALAKRIAADRAGYNDLVRQAGLPWERIEIAAGQRSRPLSGFEQAARANVMAYAELATRARDLWNSIKLTHPGPRSQRHPEFATFDGLRRDRDSLAAGLASERALHRVWSKEAGISWRSVELQAAAHHEREREASRQAGMSPGQRELRELIAEYKTLRNGVQAAWSAGDRTEADRLAWDRDAKAYALSRIVEPVSLAAARQADTRFDRHIRQAEARGLVNAFQRAVSDRAEATAQAHGQALVKQRSEERQTGGKAVARAVAEAGLSWPEIRLQAEGRIHLARASERTITPVATKEPATARGQRPPEPVATVAPRATRQPVERQVSRSIQPVPPAPEVTRAPLEKQGPRPHEPAGTATPVATRTPEVTPAPAPVVPVSQRVAGWQELTIPQYRQHLIALTGRLQRDLEVVKPEAARVAGDRQLPMCFDSRARQIADKQYLEAGTRTEAEAKNAAEAKLDMARAAGAAARRVYEDSSWWGRGAARRDLEAAERVTAVAADRCQRAKDRFTEQRRTIYQSPEYRTGLAAIRQDIEARATHALNVYGQKAVLESTISTLTDQVRFLDKEAGRLPATATIYADKSDTRTVGTKIVELLEADRRDLTAIAQGQRKVSAPEREPERERGEQALQVREAEREMTRQADRGMER